MLNFFSCVQRLFHIHPAQCLEHRVHSSEVSPMKPSIGICVIPTIKNSTVNTAKAVEKKVQDTMSNPQYRSPYLLKFVLNLQYVKDI